ncbi:hypothetical protein AcV7_003313 [Taiwanofungus camphoratus]|nr:hypothetical protein AcV7_003313 [Antrodia cinnamomea]
MSLGSNTLNANSRVWFITGSSQGIGRALLEELLVSRERVVATLRKPAVLASLTQKYPPSQLLVLPLDVTKPDQIKSALEEVKKHFGRLDVVVNNAGQGLMAEIEGVSDEEARRQMDVLFWGPFHVIKEAIPLMRDVNPPGVGGRILSISSAGGYSANPTLSIYSAGKFALEGLTESFTKEMDPSWNIKGVIVELGGFRTDWLSSSMTIKPPLPPYAHIDSPCALFRHMSLNIPYIGDPAKAPKALIAVAGLPDPPLRIQLGTDSMAMVKTSAKKTLKDAEKWADFAHQTNMDGVDKNQVLAMFNM